MRSIARLVSLGLPTAVLATGVVVAVARNGQGASAVADGDLQRDLQLASTSSIELTPAGQPLATISAVEAPPRATPARTTRIKRSATGARAVRSRAPIVRAAPEPEVTESLDESQFADATADAADAATEVAADAPEAAAAGGVALPRPTGIPVSFPTGGSGGGYDPGPGTVIRGGGSAGGDPCRIHDGRGGIYGPVVMRGPRTPGISLGDRIRAAQAGRERPRSGGLGERISAARGRSAGSSSTARAGRGSLGDRVRSARTRR